MSGFKVNFSVNNQLATPSIHAAALASRPPAGQPGRVFIDTDNPSTGIYRDTGTAWVQIAQNGGGGIPNLQQVTGVGNNTNLNLVLNYEDQTVSNALVFYNDTLAQEEYVVLKRQFGITTNDCLVIQSRGNIAPSTNPAGIMIDGANDVIKTFYGTAYTEQGLKLDFTNSVYVLGQQDFGVDINWGTGIIKIGDVNGSFGGYTWLNFDENNGTISTFAGGSENGLKLDFANNNYYFGDYLNTLGIYTTTNYVSASNSNGDGFFSVDTANSNIIVQFGDGSGISNGTTFYLNDSQKIIKSIYNGNDIGLILDFANSQFFLGDENSQSLIKVDSNSAVYIGDALSNQSGTQILVDDGNSIIKSRNGGNDIGLKLDFGNGEYFFGNFVGNGNYVWVDNANGVNLGDPLNYANNTYLKVDDNNQRLELSGNLASGTAGGSSGQHLKIRVGGVDYKIALLNP